MIRLLQDSRLLRTGVLLRLCVEPVFVACLRLCVEPVCSKIPFCVFVSSLLLLLCWFIVACFGQDSRLLRANLPVKWQRFARSRW
jgi:hypothetical protein